MNKYFNFSGLANRSEYWAVNLLVIFAGWVALLGLMLVAGMFVLLSELLGGMMVIGTLIVWFVGSIWLLLAVAVRRCRDADISVFWVVPLVIPVLWLIMTIILGVLPSIDKSFIPNDTKHQ